MATAFTKLAIPTTQVFEFSHIYTDATASDRPAAPRARCSGPALAFRTGSARCDFRDSRGPPARSRDNCPGLDSNVTSGGLQLWCARVGAAGDDVAGDDNYACAYCAQGVSWPSTTSS